MTESTPETIRYTADVVCIRGGEVLLIERGWPPHQGQLALPGGHVDPGETSRAAAARELLEETGVRVSEENLLLVGVYDAPDRDPRGRYVTVAYVVTVPADTTAQAGDDAAAVQWVPLDNPGDALAFDHSQIVYDAWRQQLDAGYARQVAAETDTGRCPAAHPSDCRGPEQAPEDLTMFGVEETPGGGAILTLTSRDEHGQLWRGVWRLDPRTACAFRQAVLSRLAVAGTPAALDAAAAASRAMPRPTT